ncbi:MAG: hypothetical protein ABI333_07030 [bacterium]
MRKHCVLSSFCVAAILAAVAMNGCGDDGNEADAQLIGAQCTAVADCDDDDDSTDPLECLTEFGGGYCGREGCTASSDCPEGSVCVGYAGGFYCFRVCIDKPDCNANRDAINESNCSSNVSSVDTDDKVCVPPSSGI